MYQRLEHTELSEITENREVFRDFLEMLPR